MLLLVSSRITKEHDARFLLREGFPSTQLFQGDLVLVDGLRRATIKHVDDPYLVAAWSQWPFLKAFIGLLISFNDLSMKRWSMMSWKRVSRCLASGLREKSRATRRCFKEPRW